MKIFISVLCLIFSLNGFSKDLTATYNKYYKDSDRLSNKDLKYLGNKDIILVPGILSEVFSYEDTRGSFDFSFLTNDYFAAQVRHLKYNLKLPTQKLLSSSKNVAETKDLIANALRKTRNNNRKALLITHSLGGLALLDYLLETDEAAWDSIEGILFLQTPFYGSPMADVFLDNPYHADKWLTPFLPFFNTSIETVTYLSVSHRAKFMASNMQRIKDIFAKIPTLTMSGITNGHKSLFTPAADVMEHGCLLNTLGHCLSRNLWNGKFDKSDGMVPLFSSKIALSDFVVIDGVDHGEPIVQLPFQDLSKELMTESLIKLMLNRPI